MRTQSLGYNINSCTLLPRSSVVRVFGLYPEGPGFKSQLDPDFSVDPNDLALPLVFRDFITTLIIGVHITLYHHTNFHI